MEIEYLLLAATWWWSYPILLWDEDWESEKLYWDPAVWPRLRSGPELVEPEMARQRGLDAEQTKRRWEI